MACILITLIFFLHSQNGINNNDRDRDHHKTSEGKFQFYFDLHNLYSDILVISLMFIYKPILKGMHSLKSLEASKHNKWII